MGIRLAGLKSTGLTSANAQDRGEGMKNQEEAAGNSCSLKKDQHTTHPPPRTTHAHTHADI